ncbi:hypothetical protein [Pseudomonas frederiksbergensis]|uniref:glycine-rich domain-containing protein n=1 Tax=Pseudomonas frederiksbergensis TaxID=104087 RepID=UPI0006973548|nr:hypothetical protein [Pseudomonas frederiksbergensis]
MHRIDGPGATVDNLFTEGDPVGGVPATVVTDDWLNDVQENIMAVIAAGGITPTKGRAADLLDSLKGRLIGIQKLTANGTYIPTPGMKNVYVKYVGGGGGSGSVPATAATQTAAAGGGASGSYGEAWLTAAQIGASQAVLVGAGGAAGPIGGAGGTGGTSSMGVLLTAPGGGGSPAGTVVSSTSSGLASGGASGPVTVGGNVLNTSGQQGNIGFALNSQTLGGSGGSNPIGSGGIAGGASTAPTAGTGYGGGAGGVSSGLSSAAKAGVVGSPGAFFYFEYS